MLAAARAARRAGDADRAEHSIARADRHDARSSADVRQELRPHDPLLGGALAVLAGGHLVGERGVRLAEAVHFGMRRGAVVAHADLFAAGMVDHRDGHLLPVRAALRERLALPTPR